MPVPSIFGVFASSGIQSVTTLNPADKAAGITLSGGNLTATNNNNSVSNVRSTTSHPTGKYHVEFLINDFDGFTSYPLFGIANSLQSLTSDMDATANGIAYERNGVVATNGAVVGGADSFTTGDVLAVEVDFGAKTIWVQKLGGTGRKGPFSFGGMTLPGFVCIGTKGVLESVTANFGGSPFSLSPTSGFSAWG